uniref:Uncharacterized protein n=1 Tax=Echeneis naucrates TaxID=173247 RepID=A0A665X402_ECHNA
KVFTQGLHCVQHFSCNSPARFMTYSEAAAAFISLHTDNSVCLYRADGQQQTSPVGLSFMGLTTTKISGWLVGWGPGPIFTLLDHELRPLDVAHDALDIRVCQPAEHSAELVTAGVGNVCVWSVRLMKCKVKIQEGLHNSTFSHMALAPPRSDRHHRAFAVCGQAVTVVDLDIGKVLEHKRDLCSRNITALVYCSHLDCLIIASEEWSIRVWGPAWELNVAFVGHNGIVNSLYYCPALHMLLSTSVDCTIRCWNVEEGDVIECVHTEQKTPLLCIGGTGKDDTFFSFSQQGVHFWSIKKLYNLHSKLKKDEGAPLRQILISPFPAPYPRRVLCVSVDGDVTLVAAETGAVLTSFKAKQRILCADYCLHKEILLALTEAGTQDHVTGNDAQKLPIPGPPCCLVLYSYVAETQTAIEDWRKLQDRRGCSHRTKACLSDAKNRFLIVLGHKGGCVSVLMLDNGKVLYRTPAHSGQKVTALQVYPKNGCLLSTGEDLTVVVWKVSPYIQDCLRQQLSLHCGQTPDHLLGSVQICFIICMTGCLFGFLTGLCVCPDLEVFVSSSLDGTVHIWNEENHLVRTLQLNTVPECLAYGGYGGELFLGIRGDLYRMNCAKFLPRKYQEMVTTQPAQGVTSLCHQSISVRSHVETEGVSRTVNVSRTH